MMNRFGAHEFLETQELIRSLAANIELHAVCASMTNDNELKSILSRHIQGMEQSYQQAVNLLQNKGMNMNPPRYGMHIQHQPQIGLNNPTMSPPNPQAQKLSEMSMCTIILNTHKAGSIFGMQWANECGEPQLRQLHITCAVNCNNMAYEVWQYMNRQGYYQVPQLADHTMQTMNQALNPTMQTMNQVTNPAMQTMNQAQNPSMPNQLYQ